MSQTVDLKELDLKNIKNIYPAIYVQHGEIKTPVSFEWYHANKEQVDLVSYSLIFLYHTGEKKEYHFTTYNAMMQTLQEIIPLLKK